MSGVFPSHGPEATFENHTEFEEGIVTSQRVNDQIELLVYIGASNPKSEVWSRQSTNDVALVNVVDDQPIDSNIQAPTYLTIAQPHSLLQN
jgi:hypothetical protein